MVRAEARILPPCEGMGVRGYSRALGRKLNMVYAEGSTHKGIQPWRLTYYQSPLKGVRIGLLDGQGTFEV